MSSPGLELATHATATCAVLRTLEAHALQPHDMRHRHRWFRMGLVLMAWPGMQGRSTRRPKGALERMDRGHVLRGSRRAHPEVDTLHVRASVRCSSA